MSCPTAIRGSRAVLPAWAEGDDLAAALEVSVALGAGLVPAPASDHRAVAGRAAGRPSGPPPPRACPELAETLSDWDGVFTARIRKRVTGHIDNCLICAATRRRLVTPTALLGAAPVLIPAPDWLRTQTLRRIRLADHDDDAGRGPRRSRAGVGTTPPPVFSPSSARPPPGAAPAAAPHWPA